jgi:hypothetical protein
MHCFEWQPNFGGLPPHAANRAILSLPLMNLVATIVQSSKAATKMVVVYYKHLQLALQTFLRRVLGGAGVQVRTTDALKGHTADCVILLLTPRDVGDVGHCA